MPKNIKTIYDLEPDPENANAGTERGIDMVEHSLSKAGAGRSILADKNGRIIAGNKTLQAAVDLGFEDIEVVKTDGKKLVVVQREDLDLEGEDPTARRLAIWDNRSAQLGLAWNTEQLQKRYEEGLGPAFTNDEMQELVTVDREEKSDGSLLSLIDVTIEEPQHIVEKGDVWSIGQHKLLCFDVITEWQEWIRYLEKGTLFAPYPGIFIPLSKKAEYHKVIMVQPDPYIAGHILDRYVEVNGEDSVSKDPR